MYRFVTNRFYNKLAYTLLIFFLVWLNSSAVLAQVTAPLPLGLSPTKNTASFSALSPASRNPADPLDPADAFKLSATKSNTDVLVRFDIVDGYYLYAEKIQISARDGVKLLPYALPKGEIHFDPVFSKNLETFRKQLQIKVKVDPKFANHALNLEVKSQGCADIGVCYPPQTQTISWPASATPAALPQPNPTPTGQTKAAPIPKTAVLSGAQTQAPSVSSQNAAVTPDVLPTPSKDALLAPTDEVTGTQSGRIAQVLSQSNLAVLMLTFIGFGLLLAFTPCVLPMVPIVSSIVIGSGKTSTRWRGLSLSAAYVLGMALVYTLVGVAAGLLGQGLTAALQNVWVLSGFALLMVILAGAQFGWYTLQLPAALSDRIYALSNQSQGGYLGAAIMGALSALMVGPCVTAPLAATLSFIAQTGQAFTGGVALFSLALGMGIPLLLIGAGAGALVPKTGAWMNTVKHLFGVMLLAVALWIVMPFVSSAVFTALCFALLLGTAILLGAFKILSPTGNPWFKALGLTALLWAGAILWGMAGGRYDVLQPLAGRPTSATGAQKADFTYIKSLDDLSAHMNQAAKTGTLVMLDIYADWCVSCIEMERFTYSDPRVAIAMQRFVRLKIDVTHNTLQDQMLLKQFGLFGPPGLLLFDEQGQEIASKRVIGYVKADAFLKHLEKI